MTTQDIERRRRTERLSGRRTRPPHSARIQCPQPDCNATPALSVRGVIARHMNDDGAWCRSSSDVIPGFVPGGQVLVSRDTLAWLLRAVETRETPPFGHPNLVHTRRVLGTPATTEAHGD